MGSTFRYLALGDDHNLVLDWFRAVEPAPREMPTERSVVLHFQNLDPHHGEHTNVDPKRSPIVTLFPPRQRRGVLWTAGEIHFLPTPLREQFPSLHRISRRLATWFSSFPRVFERANSPGDWDYYLEGTLRNGEASIFALPAAMIALRNGQYFVSDDDADFVLDKLCKSLRLRGVTGIAESDAYPTPPNKPLKADGRTSS